MASTGAAGPLSGTRVAVASASFSPEVGYQEVDLAAAFTRLGADVLVVTTTRPSRNARAVVSERYPSGTTRRAGYSVVRLEPRVVVGSNVLGCRVRPIVERFAPQYVVLVGPGKLFGLDLFELDTAPWTRIAIVQDNSDDGRSEGPAAKRLLRAVLHHVVKRRVYRRVVRRADRVVLNVPETREIISGWLSEREQARLERTGVDLRLGFDPETFFFDPDARQEWRVRFRIAEEHVVLVTCTRATPGKRLEEVIRSVSAVRALGLPLRYVVAGVRDDTYGHALTRSVAAQPDPHAFLLLPMLDHGEMRQLFSACDLGYWPRAAITIQQAMGTGLPVLLRERRNVSHLVVPTVNGWYAGAEERLDAVVARVVRDGVDAREPAAVRAERADFSRTYLSYDAIALEILSGL